MAGVILSALSGAVTILALVFAFWRYRQNKGMGKWWWAIAVFGLAYVGTSIWALCEAGQAKSELRAMREEVGTTNELLKKYRQQDKREAFVENMLAPSALRIILTVLRIEQANQFMEDPNVFEELALVVRENAQRGITDPSANIDALVEHIDGKQRAKLTVTWLEDLVLEEFPSPVSDCSLYKYIEEIEDIRAASGEKAIIIAVRDAVGKSYLRDEKLIRKVLIEGNNWSEEMLADRYKREGAIRVLWVMKAADLDDQIVKIYEEDLEKLRAGLKPVLQMITAVPDE